MLQLLREDHDEWWTRGQLRTELKLATDTLAQLLQELERHGVVLTAGEDRVAASPCVRHLDALDLIGV